MNKKYIIESKIIHPIAIDYNELYEQASTFVHGIVFDEPDISDSSQEDAHSEGEVSTGHLSKINGKNELIIYETTANPKEEMLDDYILCVTTKSHICVYEYNGMNFTQVARVFLNESTPPIESVILRMCVSRYSFIESLPKISMVMLINQGGLNVEFYLIMADEGVSVRRECSIVLGKRIAGYQLMVCEDDSYILYILNVDKDFAGYRITRSLT